MYNLIITELNQTNQLSLNQKSNQTKPIWYSTLFTYEGVSYIYIYGVKIDHLLPFHILVYE